ncbi:FAD binding domain-containing protein [Saccharopolyspora griseoalba]|uniref:FAD binding domain-containing protein n=1 Tax=Saccharopolyspora griseoalba TaxID=1431848 RepID=A0ABW2LFS8_9PSEU
MKPPPFHYVRPGNLDEAVGLLAADEDAKPLAGGQSLLPMMNFRLARPGTLVDLGRLPELTEIRRDGEVLVLGAGVRQRAAETSELVARTCPLIGRALAHVGHHQIRSRGTIGGSLAHADPAAELCAASLALDAEIVARGPGGTRAIPAAELFLAPYQTCLAEDEVITETRWPIRSGARSAVAEIARRSGDFAIAGAAVVVELTDGAVSRARLAGLGVSGAVQRLPAAERVLTGRAPDTAAIAETADAAADSIDPPEDVHADAGTRRAALRAATRQALEQIADD